MSFPRQFRNPRRPDSRPSGSTDPPDETSHLPLSGCCITSIGNFEVFGIHRGTFDKRIKALGGRYIEKLNSEVTHAICTWEKIEKTEQVIKKEQYDAQVVDLEWLLAAWGGKTRPNEEAYISSGSKVCKKHSLQVDLALEMVQPVADFQKYCSSFRQVAPRAFTEFAFRYFLKSCDMFRPGVRVPVADRYCFGNFLRPSNGEKELKHFRARWTTNKLRCATITKPAVSDYSHSFEPRGDLEPPNFELVQWGAAHGTFDSTKYISSQLLLFRLISTFGFPLKQPQADVDMYKSVWSYALFLKSNKESQITFIDNKGTFDIRCEIRKGDKRVANDLISWLFSDRIVHEYGMLAGQEA